MIKLYKWLMVDGNEVRSKHRAQIDKFTMAPYMFWGENVSHSAGAKKKGVKRRLCTSDVIHAYVNPYQAVMFKSQHLSGSVKYQLWEAVAHKIAVSDNTKVGIVTLTTIKRVRVPSFSRAAQMRFAIKLYLKKGRGTPSQQKQMQNWLDGKISRDWYTASHFPAFIFKDVDWNEAKLAIKEERELKKKLLQK